MGLGAGAPCRGAVIPDADGAGLAVCGGRAFVFVRVGTVLLSVEVVRAIGLESGRGATAFPDSLTGRELGLLLISFCVSFPSSAVFFTCESFVVGLISAMLTPLFAHRRAD